ncbi:MAG: hypothetical protein EI684_15460 [Candidatus Viridilinea halotolerans]|uniref:Uncharacterized protein n=1 Tax=Candidatus Viridilinea halotolerans TaxID=2491704 RepID=A0A426TVP9_9CHLR|nr:MAG: hypothetical protein EI684_15460 [Candidatus Viridilinea halotolerans]
MNYARKRPIAYAALKPALTILRAAIDGESPLGSPPTNILRRDSTSTPEQVELPPSAAAPAPPAWPPLPLDGGRTLAPVDVGRAMLLLVTDTEVAGYEASDGFTPGRLREVLKRAGLNDANIGRAAPFLSLWLDAAAILAPPTNPNRPWDAPRHYTIRDLDAIQARIHATPPPTPEEVVEAKRLGLK